MNRAWAIRCSTTYSVYFLVYVVEYMLYLSLAIYDMIKYKVAMSEDLINNEDNNTRKRREHCIAGCESVNAQRMELADYGIFVPKIEASIFNTHLCE